MSNLRVTRGQIIARGLTMKCPNCGGSHLFQEGKLFHMNRFCPDCGLPFERDEGSFLGAVALNYGITTICFLVPLLLLYLAGVFSGLVASVIAIVGSIAVPMLLYRPARGWWLMNYYVVLPEHLPVNQRDENDREPTDA